MKKTYKKGELILKEGATGAEAYVILSGKVEIYHVKEGKKIVLGVLGQHQIFGEMSMIDERPRSANVAALEDSELNVIDRREFNEMFYSDPFMMKTFLKNIFERLRHVDRTIIDLTMGMAAQNISENKIILTGLTPLAIQSLNGKSLEIDRFPFKIGRKTDDHEKDIFSNNDMYIEDKPPFSVSRNHLSIQYKNGNYFIVDRGSTLGTYINEERIGGKMKILEKQLVKKSENIIILGNYESPFKYEILVP